MTGERRSRRRLLRRGLAVAAAGVAGCSSLGPAGGVGETATIRETSVSGASLVVDLKEDHKVTKLNLVGPSGSPFQSTSVATGTTTAEIDLFDYRRGWHYTPGEHSLVALADGEEVEVTNIGLRPELKITSVEQYSGGKETPQNRGNLLVNVKNTGTAPTWVYYLAYEGTPNATQTPRDGHPTNSPLQALKMPKSKSETILSTSEKQAFLSRWPPFQLSGDLDCRRMQVEFYLTAYSGIGNNVRRKFLATLSGEKLQQLYRVTCTDISIEPIVEGSADG